MAFSAKRPMGPWGPFLPYVSLSKQRKFDYSPVGGEITIYCECLLFVISCIFEASFSFADCRGESASNLTCLLPHNPSQFGQIVLVDIRIPADSLTKCKLFLLQEVPERLIAT